jgi:hypothetical protein
MERAAVHIAAVSGIASDDPCGRDRLRAHTANRTGAEGATAPEPLRPKDRRGTTLWKAASVHAAGSPKE